MADAFSGPGLHVPPPPLGHVAGFVHGRQAPANMMTKGEAFAVAVNACGGVEAAPLDVHKHMQELVSESRLSPSDVLTKKAISSRLVRGRSENTKRKRSRAGPASNSVPPSCPAPVSTPSPPSCPATSPPTTKPPPSPSTTGNCRPVDDAFAQAVERCRGTTSTWPTPAMVFKTLQEIDPTNTRNYDAVRKRLKRLQLSEERGPEGGVVRVQKG